MFCKKCGELLKEGQKFCSACGEPSGCPSCGSPIEQGSAFCKNCGAALGEEDVGKTVPSVNTAGLAERSIVLAILLSLITCGIYAIYWFICLTNDMNRASGRDSDTNGVTAFLLGLITCGIYTYYWAYKLGEKRDIVAGESGSSGILYLVLFLLGFGIIAYALAQDTLNKAIARG